MELIKLPSNTNSDALEMLDEIRARIESGEISSISVAWVTNKGDLESQFSNGNNSILLWASMEHATKEFYRLNVLSDSD